MPAWAHASHDAPGVARHVANHGRLDLHAATPAQRNAPLHQPQQFLRPAQAGQLVAVHAVELDLPGADGVDQSLLFFRRCLAQIAVHRPKHLGIPLEPRLRRIVGRLRNQFQRFVDVVPLSAHHLGLKVRVADVDVRMRQQIDRHLSRRLERRLSARLPSARHNRWRLATARRASTAGDRKRQRYGCRISIAWARLLPLDAQNGVDRPLHRGSSTRPPTAGRVGRPGARRPARFGRQHRCRAAPAPTGQP